MKSKILTFLLVFVLLFVGVSCGNTEENKSEHGDDHSGGGQPAAATVTLETVYDGATIDLCPQELRSFLNEENEEEQRLFLLENEQKNFDYQAVQFRWTGESDRLFSIYFSQSRQFERSRVIALSQNYFQADIFVPGEQYYWKVKGEDSGAVSDVDSFFTNDLPTRTVTVDGLTNVRDCGGWKTNGGKSVRYGMIYRGCQLNGYGNGPVLSDTGRSVFVNDLNMFAEIDLRTPEVDDGGQTKNFLDAEYPYLKAPFYAYTCIFPEGEQLHRGFDERAPEAFHKIFSFLCDERNYPVYIHCNAGADRTGTIAFLLNGLLGVPYDDLTKDFEITSFSHIGKRWRADLTEERFEISEGIMQDDGSNYVAWGKMYKYMTKYYGTDGKDLSWAISNYLQTVCNVSVAQQQTIKDILLA